MSQSKANNKKEVLSMQQIANIHVERIKQAMDDTKTLFPLDNSKVQNLDKLAIYSLEMLTNRFAKLQDYLGSVVFDAFFAIDGENLATWTQIDKINKLEKYGIIQDAKVWRTMRKARNLLAHEYPDMPDIVATNLNVIHDLIPILLDINSKIFAKILQELQ